MKIFKAAAALLFVTAFSCPAGAARGLVPVYDARFSPPLVLLSNPGPDGRLLAVQASPDSSGPENVIAIDGRGKTGLV